MDDEALRLLFYWTVALGVSGLCLSGFLTRVAGTFSEGGRDIELKQVGPIVWGASTFEGGRQTYTGLTSLGRLRLVRRDFGEAHLMTLGFAAKDAPRVEGQAMGIFRLRVGQDTLAGQFWGYRFREEGGLLRANGLGPAQPRVWRRAQAD